MTFTASGTTSRPMSSPSNTPIFSTVCGRSQKYEEYGTAQIDTTDELRNRFEAGAPGEDRYARARERRFRSDDCRSERRGCAHAGAELSSEADTNDRAFPARRRCRFR